ncbi:hypothetical protein GGTG_06954 [Gaeumannomyces tritici R3-111a-1]|uniref:Uncharacterized protein n=1 Tax=Gaeumannomyces tritici (strain R3-111a-1) TaxID=644352 RepID=J3P0A7_GAET3|nr:hypothetical protein GGTG_06954 [Gaeumannomyces tritici R3-111a-1]EJT77040.1 hypothetical protein GGTG_06954 [Gaeumannomyces tritici R3-111a-1]
MGAPAGREGTRTAHPEHRATALEEDRWRGRAKGGGRSRRTERANTKSDQHQNRHYTMVCSGPAANGGFVCSDAATTGERDQARRVDGGGGAMGRGSRAQQTDVWVWCCSEGAISGEVEWFSKTASTARLA